MRVTAIKTRKIYPKDDLLSLLFASLPPLQEKQLLVISGKILSLCFGYFIRKEELKHTKDALIRKEADYFWQSEEIQLTIKDNSFIPSAGIDESNSAGTYVLLPKNLFLHASQIWDAMRKYYNVNELGVLITDSQIVPLRRGTLGLGLSWCGFHPLYSYIGEEDCFQRKHEKTYLNLVDSYATAAIAEMGEGNEQCPIALIEEAPKIQFMVHPPNKKEQTLTLINKEEDLFYPLICGSKPIKGGNLR